MPSLRTNLLLASLALLAVAACDRPPTYVFRCPDGAELRARYVRDTLLLELAGESAALPPARAASGARYANDTLEFWEHAGAVRVLRHGRLVHENCRVDAGGVSDARAP